VRVKKLGIVRREKGRKEGRLCRKVLLLLGEREVYAIQVLV
jgi:hypothetical protein